VSGIDFRAILHKVAEFIAVGRADEALKYAAGFPSILGTAVEPVRQAIQALNGSAAPLAAGTPTELAVSRGVRALCQRLGELSLSKPVIVRGWESRQRRKLH
jgi:hypothetical protein